jgi:hypothetical protein
MLELALPKNRDGCAKVNRRHLHQTNESPRQAGDTPKYLLRIVPLLFLIHFTKDAP